MSRYPKNFKDVEYFVPGRKRRVARSTKATSAFLAVAHRENPTATISELREIINDKRHYITNPEAVEVLDAHIRAGYGSHIPDWRY